MESFEFTIIASGFDPNSEFENKLYEAGCNDSTVAFMKGRTIIEFRREAKSFGHALLSAIVDVTRAGGQVERVEPDYLVSLSEMSERSALSRSAMSHYAKGIRRQGFPAPIARITSESPLWDWVEVARWLFHRRAFSRRQVIEAKLVREANRAIFQTEGQIEQSFFARRVVAARELESVC